MKKYNKNLNFDFDIQELNINEAYYVNSALIKKKSGDGGAATGLLVKSGAILAVLYVFSFVVLFVTMAMFNYFFKIDSVLFGIVLFVIAYIISYIPMGLYLGYVYVAYFAKKSVDNKKERGLEQEKSLQGNYS